MPRRPIATENRVGEGGSKFPKLDFKEKGERKRILLIDPEGPWQEYVHQLVAPKFKEGAPVMTTRERRGEEVPDYETDFIGRPLCPGDAATIEELGFDERNCPACARVREAPPEARLAPQLRFAANVVDQVLQPGTWNIRKPYSASILIWTFTSGMYDEIIGLQEQHGKLIRTRDISLECSNPKFNQVKMGVMPQAGWEEVNAGAVLKELLETPGNVATEDQLRDACGRTVKRQFFEDDIKLCLKRWRRALVMTQGTELGDQTAGAPLGGSQQDLTEATRALLNEGTSQPNGQPADPWTEERTERAVTEIQAAKAEVRAELGLDGGPATTGTDMFTNKGQERAEAEHAAAVTAKHGEGVDPFGSGSSGSVSGSGTDPFTASTSASSQASASAAEPASSPEPESQAEPRKSSFDQLYQDLMGN